MSDSSLENRRFGKFFIHMKRMYRTFGEFIGEMNPLTKEAFKTINTEVGFAHPNRCAIN